MSKKAISFKKLQCDTIKVNSNLVSNNSSSSKLNASSQLFYKDSNSNKQKVIIQMPSSSCKILKSKKDSDKYTIVFNLQEVPDSIFSKFEQIDEQICTLVDEKWNKKKWFNDDEFSSTEELVKNYTPLCKWVRVEPRSRDKVPLFECDFNPSLFLDSNKQKLDDETLEKFIQLPNLESSLIMYLKQVSVKGKHFTVDVQVLSGRFKNCLEPPSDSDCENDNDELTGWEEADPDDDSD
tara:strand:+ start:4279 stop:4989 length:711 start_codon:yes stop_codon:yes gene_type:complete